MWPEFGARFVRLWLAALIAAASAWPATAAQEGKQVGLLACTLTEQSSSDAAATRQALCAFKPKSGAQETYAGNIQLVKPSAVNKMTLVWRVTIPAAMSAAPGFLQQNYAADPRASASHLPDLVGEANPSVILQSMADRTEGSASAKEKLPAEATAVLRVELKLKSTTG
jgi:hypothetical protein